MNNQRPLIWPLVAAALVLLLANRSIGLASSQNLNISTRVQARISHESKNLDLADLGEADKLGLNTSEAPETTTIATKVKKRIKKGRSDGSLANIWSMLMPSSAANNDYEEADDVEAESVDKPSVSEKQNDPYQSTETTRPKTASNLTTVSHDEHLVSKYSRPPRGQTGPASELLLSSSSGPLVQAFQQNQSTLAPTRNETSASGVASSARSSHQPPVKLMTGSLSKADGGVSISEAVSNIMSSIESMPTEVSGESSATSTEITSTQTNPIEHEEDEVLLERKTDKLNQTRSDNFERWLNKIQFQETSTRLPPLDTTSTSKHVPTKPFKHPNLESGLTALKRHESTRRNNASATDLLHMAELLNDLRLNQQQQQQTKNHQQTKFARQQPSMKSTHSVPFQQQRIQLKSKTHPLQPQLKQQQFQLIHGIRYPQASTISVSTQDGASNTSLSFSNQPSLLTSFIDDLMGPSEVSQVINGTSQSSGGQVISSVSNTENGQTVEQQQSVYQSQDEILRQVTSAINLDQQQLSKGQQKHQATIYNHRRPGESLAEPAATNLANDGNSKMFKVGATISEVIDTTTTTTTTTTSTSTTTKAPQLDQPGQLNAEDLFKASLSSRQVTNGTSSGTLGMDDIDKSFDFLAEKLRQLAQQQQQLNNSNQPSWLRKPTTNDANDLLNRLTANLNGQQQQSSSGVNLDQLRELLDKHEKSKNELKNSQVTMALLMQQLMQGDKSASLDRSQSEQQTSGLRLPAQSSMTNLIGGPEGSSEANEQDHKQQPDGKQLQVGWTPVKPSSQASKAGSQVPPSPANMVKNRTKQQPVKLPQPAHAADNVGEGFIHPSNLASMFANSARAQLGEAHHQATVDQNLIGLPIAILKEEDSAIELPQAQLEAAAAAAAEQLLGSGRGQDQLAMLHQPQAAPQAEQLNQIQKILQRPQGFGPNSLLNRAPGSNEAGIVPMIRSSAAGEDYSMKHLNQALSLNNMASLLQDPPYQQQPELQNALKTFTHSPESEFNRNQHLMVSANHEGPNDLSSHRKQTGVSQDNNLPPGRSNQQQQSQKRPIQQDDSRSRGYAHEDEFRLQRQPAQLMQSHQMVSGQRHSGYDGIPMRPDLVNPPHHYSRPPMVTTTTVTSGGPPVKLREVAFYRPFGFRQTHSVAYQANPTLAAMFSGSHHRPSLFRHMSPIRASFHEGQHLLAPLTQPLGLGNSLRQYQMDPYGHHHHPLLAGRQPMMGDYGQPLKRHSMAYGGPNQMDQRWPPKLVDSTLTASDMKVQHLDPSEIVIEQEGDDLEPQHIEDHIKYVPMESLSEHTFSLQEPPGNQVRPIFPRPPGNGVPHKSRPPRGYQPANRSGQRGRSIQPRGPFPFDFPANTMTMMPCLNPTLKSQSTSQNGTSTTPLVPATTTVTVTAPAIPANFPLKQTFANTTSI